MLEFLSSNDELVVGLVLLVAGILARAWQKDSGWRGEVVRLLVKVAERHGELQRSAGDGAGNVLPTFAELVAKAAPAELSVGALDMLTDEAAIVDPKTGVEPGRPRVSKLTRLWRSVGWPLVKGTVRAKLARKYDVRL